MNRSERVPWASGLASKAFLAVSCVVTFGLTSWAGTTDFLYANNAGGTGTDAIWQINLTTGGVITNEYDVPGIGNGRGVIDVNNILYITTASSGNVYAFNTATSALSTVFTVSGASALASITYNGSDFWIANYSGTNQAYLYTPTGVLLKTITLSQCTAYCDGLTYIPANGGELLSNREDGAFGLNDYDLYNTDGTLIQSDFIDTSGLSAYGCSNSTGVAWDGTDFWVSCIYGKIAEYNSSGAFVQVITLSNPMGFNNGGQGALIEGLSANFATTLTPEPITLYLVGMGLAGVGFIRKKWASK